MCLMLSHVRGVGSPVKGPNFPKNFDKLAKGWRMAVQEPGNCMGVCISTAFAAGGILYP